MKMPVSVRRSLLARVSVLFDTISPERSGPARAQPVLVSALDLSESLK
jgi:hypothetical protein